jgi:uncharacterized membrane protein
MDEDAALLRRLQVDDLPPSTVDLGRAVLVGRRRERLGTVLTGGLVAGLVFGTIVAVAAVTQKGSATPRPGISADASPSPQPAPPLENCTIGKAPVTSVTSFTKLLADRSGQVFVTDESLPGGDLTLWRGGHEQRIEGVPTGSGQPAAVNGSGAFVGASGYKPAWVYRDGAFTVLPLPPDVSAVSMAGINERGDIIGTAFYWADGRSDTRAVLWRAGHEQTPVLLETTAGWSSDAVDIADDGTVVGYLSHRTDNGPNDVTPTAWAPDGAARRLPMPAAWQTRRIPHGGPFVYAIAGDWVVGDKVRWNLRTGAADVVDGLTIAKVDEHGRVFGYLPDGTPTGRPAVWVNGDVQLLPSDPGRPDATLSSVSLDGRHITGTSRDATLAKVSATAWTCGR